MKKPIAFSLLFILLATACSPKSENNGGGANAPSSTQAQETAAQTSAEQWLALVDAGNYADSWKTSAAYFQTAVTQDQWAQTAAGVRKPLGDLVSRKFKSAQYTKTVPGAPDGEYVILQFDTSFANKKEAVETITPKLETDGTWKVSGYYIK
jgi:hypothetical protein